MISESTIVPTGDLRKDVMMFNEAYLLDHSDTVLRGIEYYLDRDQKDSDSKNIDDLSRLEEEELKNIRTEITICATTKNNCRKLTFEDVHTFAKGLSCCYFRITKMRLTQCALSGTSIRHLSKALKFCAPHLQSVSLDRNPINQAIEERDTEMKEDISKIDPNLLKLYKNNKLPPPPSRGGGKRKTKELDNSEAEKGKKRPSSSSSRKRAKSDLTETFVAPPIPKSVLKQSPFCYFLKRKIKHLCLRDCGIGDVEAEALAEALSNHTSLVTLNLWGNSIGKKGLAKLGEGIRTNKTLVAIDLSMNNRISDQGVNAFAKNCFGWKEIVGFDNYQKFRLRIYQGSYGIIQGVTDSALSLPIPEWVKGLIDEGHPLQVSHPEPAGKGKKGKKTARPRSREKTAPFNILECDLLTEEDDTYGEDGGVILVQKPMPPEPEETSKSGKKKKKEAPKAKSSKSTKGGGSKKSARRKEREEEERKKREEEERKEKERLMALPFKFLVMGNRTLKSLSFSCNRKVGDAGLLELVKRISFTGLKRISFSNCRVSDLMLKKIGEEMSEDHDTI